MNKKAYKRSIEIILLNSLIFLLHFSSPYCHASAYEKPLVFIQIGHSLAVKSVAISENGKFVLTGSMDHTAKLWDVETGREIRTFTGHSLSVDSVAFSPDGAYALTGSGDTTAKLWDIETGREIYTLIGHSSSVHSVAFSSDGKYILTEGGDGAAKLWDVKKGREVHHFELSSSHPRLRTAAFSHDGKYVLTASKDNSARLWDIETSQEVRAFEAKPSDVCSVALSRDGKSVLTGHGLSAKLWDVETGKKIRSFENHSNGPINVAFSPDGKYVLTASIIGYPKLWDIQSVREIHNLKPFEYAVSSSVLFTPDGKKILMGLPGNVVKLWDVETGKEIRTFTGHASVIYSLVLSSNGKFVLTGSGDNTAKLWDVETGREIRNFGTLEKMPLRASDNSHLNSVTFSPDGGNILIANGNRFTAKLWNIKTGREIRSFRHTNQVTSAAFGPNGKNILTGTYNSALLWDVETGKEIRTFEIPFGFVSSVAISPNEKYALTGGSVDHTAKLWDVETGKEIRTLTGHSAPVHSVAFSPDGKFALTGSADNTAKLWNVETGREVRTFKGRIPKGWNSYVSSVAFSPNGKMVVIGIKDTFSSTGESAKLYDIRTGKLIDEYQGHTNDVCSVAFSPNGTYMLTGSDDHTAKLWNVETGREIQTLTGHSSGVNSVAFSPDGEFALTGSCDGTIKLWNYKSEEEICMFVSLFDDEWISILPEGYYNSSPYGHKNINVTIKNKVYGINQFYDVFYRPDIVEHKLKGNDINELISLTIEDALKNPPPEIKIAALPKETDQKKINVSYNISSAGGGIGEVRVFQNGKIIKSDGFYRKRTFYDTIWTKLDKINSRAIYDSCRRIVIKSKSEGITATHQKGDRYEDNVKLDVLPGKNEISICAFNKDNTIQSAMQTTSFVGKGKQTEPQLHILAIGIDKYKDSSNNLKFAAKDAGDFIDKMTSESRSLYKKRHIHATLITNKHANRENIVYTINKVSDKVKPNDVFVFFVASHGVLFGDQYYMVTHDYNGTLDDSCLISSNDLIEITKKIKSLKQIYVLDTCHAGGVDYVVNGLYDARISVLAKKAGLHVYASSSSFESALDGYEGNGLFTHNLLSGLDNNRQVDKNGDQSVSVVELGKYTEELTDKIAKQMGFNQKPKIINWGSDLTIYLLR